MKQRLTFLAFAGILLLASVFDGASPAEAQTSHPHIWYFQNIFAIVNTGNANAHRIDGLQKCAVAGETQYGSTYESHNHVYIWFTNRQYSSTHHHYVKGYRCTACGHEKEVVQLEAHYCESQYDTQCSECGYTNVRMCG